MIWFGRKSSSRLLFTLAAASHGDSSILRENYNYINACLLKQQVMWHARLRIQTCWNNLVILDNRQINLMFYINIYLRLTIGRS
ncbi:MAG: hypothetical protein WB290_02125, partial [Smithella sp.]